MLLLLAVAGKTVINLATANPGYLLFFPEEPVTTPPTIILHSPVQSQTYNSTSMCLNFTIIKPETWFPNRDWDVGNYIFVNITDVYYVVDGGQPQKISVNDVSSIFDASQTRNLPVSTNLTLAKGTHEVKVLFEAKSYFVTSYQTGILSNVTMYGESEPVNFTQELAIEVTSIENRTYDTSSMPFDFTVNDAESQITYSLDGAESTTIAGNTTLTGLANGNHNLTIYAQDEAGNIGASETIYFNVDVPFPTVLVGVASGVSVIVVGMGLLVCFKKRKR